jgi:hypothetical protein
VTGLLRLWVLACEYAALLARLVAPHPGRRARRQWPSLTPWPMAADPAAFDSQGGR